MGVDVKKALGLVGNLVDLKDGRQMHVDSVEFKHGDIVWVKGSVHSERAIVRVNFSQNAFKKREIDLIGAAEKFLAISEHLLLDDENFTKYTHEEYHKAVADLAEACLITRGIGK